MLDFSRFEVITFDCYGTLINWEAGILPALHRILAAHGQAADDGMLLKLYGDFELRAEQGKFQPYREVRGFAIRRRIRLRAQPGGASFPRRVPADVAAMA